MLHVVLSRVADRIYAFPSADVVEVIPRVIAQVVPQAPGWVLGWINFRGRLILALDFSRLRGDAGCAARMANRILVLRTGAAGQEPNELTGVLVDAVLGSERLDFSAADRHARLAPPEATYLTDAALADSQLVQLVDPRKLPRPFAGPETVPC